VWRQRSSDHNYPASEPALPALPFPFQVAIRKALSCQGHLSLRRGGGCDCVWQPIHYCRGDRCNHLIYSGPGSWRALMSISIRTLAGVLRAWYASVAIGQIERVERRGQYRKHAETQTAITLAMTSLWNLLTVLMLLGWRAQPDFVFLWVAMVIALSGLACLHLTALRGWVRSAERPSDDYARRARRSLAYFAVSLLGFLAVGAYVLRAH